MFWSICGLHVLGEWMLVWISSLRMAAAIHHQVDPSSIFQSIVIPSLVKKAWNQSTSLYISPAKHQVFFSQFTFSSFSWRVWTFNVGTFPPTHQPGRFGVSRQEQEDLGEASNNEKDQYPKPEWDWGWLQRNGNVQEGRFFSWVSEILVDVWHDWHVIHISGTCSDTASNCSNAIWSALDQI